MEEKKTETIVEENVSKEKSKELSKDSLVVNTVEIIEKPAVVKEEQKIDKPEQPVTKVEEIATPVTKAEEIAAPVAEEYKPTVVTRKAESSNAGSTTTPERSRPVKT